MAYDFHTIRDKNTPPRTTCVILIILLVSSSLSAQSIQVVIHEYVTQLRVSPNLPIPGVLVESNNARAVAAEGVKYFQDTLSKVRARMYALVAETTFKSTDRSIKKLATNSLVSATSDIENLDIIFTQLSLFTIEDFSQDSKDSLISLFHRQPPYLDQLTRLAGTLQLKELTEELRLLSGQATKNQRVRWAALISLARMGDKEAIRYMMKRVQRLPVNDDVVFEVFPDLIYTRQREAFDYLIIELNSDEKKCFTADAEDETPITCAYRIMEMLAPVIDSYPLQTDASGDIKTKDYQKSLNTVRLWFEKNKSYKILE